MVIYKFIEIPSEEYKDRLSDLGMNAYKLYAYTNDKKLRKKFKNIYPSTLSGLVYNLEEIYVAKGEK